jgi:hypothetical protein
VKQGDLVQISPRDGAWELAPGEPAQCVFLGMEGVRAIWEEWGDQVAGECDCLVLWRGEVVPFNSEDLVPIHMEEQ